MGKLIQLSFPSKIWLWFGVHIVGKPIQPKNSVLLTIEISRKEIYKLYVQIALKFVNNADFMTFFYFYFLAFRVGSYLHVGCWVTKLKLTQMSSDVRLNLNSTNPTHVAPLQKITPC